MPFLIPVSYFILYFSKNNRHKISRKPPSWGKRYEKTYAKFEISGFPVFKVIRKIFKISFQPRYGQITNSGL